MLLTKNCRKILRTLNKEKASHPYFTVDHISRRCGLPEADAQRAVEYLVEGDFLKYCDLSKLPGKHASYCDPPIVLTELGTNYRTVRRLEILTYLADKWMDIAACIIAIISLVWSLTHTI